MDGDYYGYGGGGESLRSVRAGERAVDATLATLDGETVRLADLWREGPLVLEFGSVTCPIFVGHVDRMDELAGRFDEVEFRVVYTQEEHPDESVPLQETFAEKVERVEGLGAGSPSRSAVETPRQYPESYGRS